MDPLLDPDGTLQHNVRSGSCSAKTIPTRLMLSRSKLWVTSIIFWNIAGASKIMQDPNLEAYLNDFDIICLQESWKVSENPLAGFEEFLSPAARPKPKGHPKGRLSIYITTCKSFNTKLIDLKSAHILAIIIENWMLEQIPMSILIINIYINPNMTRNQHMLDTTEKELLSLKMAFRNAPWIITGDFNLNMTNHGKRRSREGALDQRLGIPPQESPFKDKDKCDHLLVRLLEALGLRGLNGSFPKDIPMNTSHTAKKFASTLDYTFVSTDIFKYFQAFSIDMRFESDHHPQTMKIANNNILAAPLQRTDEQDPGNHLHRIRWSNKYMEKYEVWKANLTSDQMEQVDKWEATLTSLRNQLEPNQPIQRRPTTEQKRLVHTDIKATKTTA
ncbi:hypothetical protein NDU88_007951 [Pleurodeles waltl]|uniref:Endonuclease/exonuclease/phosphatase domain-containing protein n=1 Tax=Pleurodeles waltl TaxID=8319 RepID=A0AAV7NUJ2_PLEWA|nr:hypothetical protein NDU88_007951 [Pleurodeles waltl]